MVLGAPRRFTARVSNPATTFETASGRVAPRHEPCPAVVARPTNVRRSLFHVLSGAFALALIRFLPSRAWLAGAALAFALFCWTCEVARRISPKVNARLMRFFAPIARAEEHYRVNSSTWYGTALFLLAAFAPMRAAEIGVIVLAIADPFAGLVGRRFGRTPLLAGRSLEGSLGFLAAGGLAALGWLAVFSGLAGSQMVMLAFAAAAVGAVAEVVSMRFDDNFTIPVASAAAVAVLEMALPGT